MVSCISGQRTNKKKKTTMASEESRLSRFMVLDGRKHKKGMKVMFHVLCLWGLSEKERSGLGTGLGLDGRKMRGLKRE